MIRLVRLGLVAGFVLTAHAALLAAPWVSGRGVGNAGANPDTPFPALPATVWKTTLGSAFNVAPTNALLADGKVILAYGKRLLAISAATGELQWQQALEDDPVGEILLLDDQIIITHKDGIVYAFNPADGKQVWKQRLTSTVVNGPTFSDDVLLFATRSNTVDVVERKTGKRLVGGDVNADIVASPLSQGKSVLLFFKQGMMVRLENGANRWTASVPKTSFTITPASSGRLLLANTATTVFSVNSASTSTPIRWQFTRPDLVTDAVTTDGEAVYLATTSGRLLALEGQTGQSKWGKDGLPLLAPAIASPLLIGDNLFVRMKYGLVAAYAKDSGKLAWAYRLEGKDVLAGAPVVDGQDLYFGASDGTIYHLAGSMPDDEPPVFREIIPTKAGADFGFGQQLSCIGADIVDEGVGVQPESITLKLDGTDLSSQLQYDGQSNYYYVRLDSPMVPATGMHTITLSAKDRRGNGAEKVVRFYVGNAATVERVPIMIAKEYLPQTLKVRPGTIVEWVNHGGSPRTVIADDSTFTSDKAFPDGIPADGHWIWVVPDNFPAGMKLFYHCRLQGQAGNGKDIGRGLAGAIEIVGANQDVPGLPPPNTPLPGYPNLPR